MADEKPKRERFSFGPLYAPKDIVEKVNSIPEIAGAITGTEKVVAIINGFSFYHQWKDKVANLESGNNPEDQARIAELEKQLATEQENVRALSTDNDRYAESEQEKDAKIAELEEKIRQLEEQGGTSESTISEKDEKIKDLEAQVVALQSQKPDWPAIKSTLDPVYAEMMEEVARELNQDDPMMMAVDIFAKYHIYRYTELPFQPFIPVKVLDEIINRHYPELGDLRGLRKKLDQ